MPRITFLPAGVVADVPEGTTLLDAATQVGVRIQTTCGGKASCRLCKVRIPAGESSISPLTFVEQSALGNVFYITRERLSCQTRATGDCTVETLENELPAVKKPFRPIRATRP